jgi:hypothetical protein
MRLPLTNGAETRPTPAPRERVLMKQVHHAMRRDTTPSCVPRPELRRQTDPDRSIPFDGWLVISIVFVIGGSRVQPTPAWGTSLRRPNTADRSLDLQVS